MRSNNSILPLLAVAGMTQAVGLPDSLTDSFARVPIPKPFVVSSKFGVPERPGQLTTLVTHTWAQVAIEPPANQTGPTNGTDGPKCVPQAAGYGPRPKTDTPNAWRELVELTSIAQAATVPAGYSVPEGGVALNASVVAIGFEGITYLEGFDPSTCAKLCDKRRECIAFNLYFERDPLYDPADGCPSPNSTTNIKCVYWGNEIDPALATNKGEMRRNFTVLVGGSNLYNKINPGANLTAVGFSGPRKPRVKAVFQPPREPIFNYETMLGHQVYPYRQGFYYNPEVCANECMAMTERNAQDRKHGKAPPAHYLPHKGGYDVCNVFAAFELHRNNLPSAMVCMHYSAAWSNVYATWMGSASATGKGSNGTAADRDGNGTANSSGTAAAAAAAAKPAVEYKPKLVEVYTRSDYAHKPICADPDQCHGDSFHGGGDCSGWGNEYCQVVEGSST